MGSIDPHRLSWKLRGETSCPCCGARYRVEAAPLPARQDGYARCEACDSLMDEWICSEARRYVRMPNVPAAPEPRDPPRAAL